MRNAHMGILKFAFWWLPTLRWFGEYTSACERGRVKELHCREGERTYTRGEFIVLSSSVVVFEVDADGWAE